MRVKVAEGERRQHFVAGHLRVAELFADVIAATIDEMFEPPGAQMYSRFCQSGWVRSIWNSWHLPGTTAFTSSPSKLSVADGCRTRADD